MDWDKKWLAVRVPDCPKVDLGTWKMEQMKCAALGLENELRCLSETKPEELTPSRLQKLKEQLEKLLNGTK